MTSPQPPLIQLVVAYSLNRVIGRDGGLPWRLPSDLAHFKRVTLNHPIIMGRRTWDSLGRALPGRRNLVVTRQEHFQAPQAEIYPSLDAALQACQNEDLVSVIGGEQIFSQALDQAHTIIATEVQANIEGDTWFPALDAHQWQEIDRDPQPAENGLAFDIVRYRQR